MFMRVLVLVVIFLFQNSLVHTAEPVFAENAPIILEYYRISFNNSMNSNNFYQHLINHNIKEEEIIILFYNNNSEYKYDSFEGFLNHYLSRSTMEEKINFRIHGTRLDGILVLTDNIRKFEHPDFTITRIDKL